MAITKEVSFSNGVTVVDAAWLNLLQEHLAGLSTIDIETPTATQVRIKGGDNGEAASIYIGGEQRFRDTSVSFTFTTEPSGQYKIYVTATPASDSFGISVTQGVPATTPYRQVGTVTWNGAAITQYRVLRGRGEAHDHSALGGAGVVSHADLTNLDAGDPHTQYILPDGSRAFAAVVAGITPTTDDALATKGYVDGLAGAGPAIPVGAVFPFAGATAPGGYAICDGSALDTTAYADLFAVLAYAYGGAGASFNLPDLRDRIPLGKAASGTGATLGETGGSKSHTHAAPTHAHSTGDHTHGSTSHSHSTPTSGSDGAHTHTQASTGTATAHTHTGPSHTHSATSLTAPSLSEDVVGSENGSQATRGLYSQDSLAVFDSASHSHGDGSYTTGIGAVTGTSASGSASHYHGAAAQSYRHTHGAGSVSGSVAAGGTGSTGSDGDHSHTNPTTASDGDHTHSGGTTGSSSETFTADGAGSTDTSGSETTGAANVPYIVVNYIIRTGV